MLPASLRISVFLIISQLVHSSQQQCLGTSKVRGSDYTFALAGISNINNPLGPQEACYFGCGAQIVTQSSNRGDMSRLTLMDNAASTLISSGFLQSGQIYFLNHLGMEDSEGGNGIGCIQVLPKNRVAHYPREHQVCSKANTAICGFWGQQSIPPQPRPKPSSSSVNIPVSTKNESPPAHIVTTTSSSALARATTTRARRPRPTRNPRPTVTSRVPSTGTVSTKVESISPRLPIQPPPPSPSITLPATSSANEILPEIETISDLSPFIDEKLPLEEQPAEDILHQFNADGQHYHVVSKDGNSLAQAHQSCQNSQTNIGGVTSAGYQAVAENLQNVMLTTGNKLIIGSWNGDNYSLRGNNCLILQVNNGIYPGSCAEATAVLCQS
ncbi:hypothetical protein BD408DRAFT_420834 [Parasitella parasitica]|nr:hypothetical protein BD408DRAFT_420834 [Parasitella parasitica]